jgi:hypothetical protein
MFIVIVIAALAITAVVASVVALRRDGYHRTAVDREQLRHLAR